MIKEYNSISTRYESTIRPSVEAFVKSEKSNDELRFEKLTSGELKMVKKDFKDDIIIKKVENEYTGKTYISIKKVTLG